MSLSDKAIDRAGGVFEQADLGDPRRTRRALALTRGLARSPQLSLPRTWDTPAELEAAYRFLRSEHSDFEQLMEAVQTDARRQVLEHQRVLVLHDTTDVTCPAAEAEEVGFLQTGKPGFYVHHALAVSAEQPTLPLGVLWSQLWGREKRSKGRGRNRAGSELAKLKERESDRWLEGATEAHLWTEGSEQAVHVMDREADSYRLFAHMQHLGADFVVRLRHDRRLGDGGHIAETLAREPVKLTREVSLSPRKGKTMPRHTHKGRPSRRAKLSVRCSTVEVRPPNYLSDHEPVQLHVVQILEESPPSGMEPVSWVLATTLPVNTVAELEAVIDFYSARWVIEEFHKAIKTGCMFEKRQLESFQSITTLLALSYPVATELLRVRTRARNGSFPASEAFRQTMLDCLRAHPKARPFSENPTAEEVLGVIAALGGHQKHNGPPGWQSLAAGYKKVLDFEAGWVAAIASRNL